MRERWSVQGLASWALVLSFLSVMPLVGLVYYRLSQLRAHAPRWAELAQASRELGQAASCDPTSTPAAAVTDLQRWHEALVRLTAARAAFVRDQALYAALTARRAEIEVALSAEEPATVGAWVRANCEAFAGLAERALARSIDFGLDPTSRAGRFEDLAVRDVTAYLALWAVVVAALLLWVRRAIVRPARRLSRVMQRIADGDLSTDIPVVDGGEMLELTRAVQRAVDAFENRDKLKDDKIVEQRDLVRRLVDLVDDPVLVVGREHRIDYANEAAAAAFGEPLERFEDAELGRLPGGEAVIAAVDEIMHEGEAHVDRLLSTHPLRRERHLARCAVVRDRVGAPTRVIIVLRAAGGGAWWRRLFGPSDDEAAS